MNNNTQACDDDDLPPPEYNAAQTTAEVKYKPIVPSFHTYFFIILGTICILLGIIDMIVFYVVPNNEIKKNKKEYSGFEFEKPRTSIVVIHFLLHINLIVLGAAFISSIDRDFCESLSFMLLISLSATSFACLYICELTFSGSYIEFIKHEDFKLEEISKLLNSSNPIDSLFFYTKGKVHGKKKYRTCYSDRGFDLTVQSTLYPPYFNRNEYKPDYFYIQITQKVNFSEELFLYVEKAKLKIYSCENKHGVETNYYPLIEGKQLILKEGGKIPSKMKSSNAIASLIFGLGIYPELLEKSIPIKKIDQNSYVYAKSGIDYGAQIASIDCSYIGICKSKNKKPHM